MVQGIAFLSKKSWHTKNLNNQEKVWIAEQRKAAEETKTKELARQIQLEREREELDRLAGKKTHLDRGIDWMYSGQAANKKSGDSNDEPTELEKQDAEKRNEEFLLGKEFTGDSGAKQGHFSEAAGVAEGVNAVVVKLEDSNTTSSVAAAADGSVAERNEAFRQRVEDPMFMVSQKEREKRIEAGKQKALYERVMGGPVTGDGDDDDDVDDSSEDNKKKKNSRKERKRERKERRRREKEEKKQRKRKGRDYHYDSDEEDNNDRKRHRRHHHNKREDSDFEDDERRDRRRHHGGGGGSGSRNKKHYSSDDEDYDSGREYHHHRRHDDRRRHRRSRHDHSRSRSRSRERHHHEEHETNRKISSGSGSRRHGRRTRSRSRSRSPPSTDHHHHHHHHSSSSSRHNRHYDRDDERRRYNKRDGDDDEQRTRYHGKSRGDNDDSYHRREREHQHQKPPAREGPTKKAGYGLQGASNNINSSSSNPKDLGPAHDLLKQKRQTIQEERRRAKERGSSRRTMTAEERTKALEEMQATAHSRSRMDHSRRSGHDDDGDEAPTRGKANFIKDVTEKAHGIKGNSHHSMASRMQQNRNTQQRLHDNSFL